MLPRGGSAEAYGAMELKNDVVFADVHTSKFPKGARFKQPDVDDRQMLYPSIDFTR